MSHRIYAALDDARDTLVTVAALAYVLGFLAAIELALTKLAY